MWLWERFATAMNSVGQPSKIVAKSHSHQPVTPILLMEPLKIDPTLKSWQNSKEAFGAAQSSISFIKQLI